MKTIALIPARGGSKGVPGKNIKPLGGYPLISYSIAAARMSQEIDRVIVSTDSKEIAEISRRFGAEVPFFRPAQYAQDQSPDADFVIHALDWFEKNEGETPEYLVHLRPTTPFRDPAVVDEGIRQTRRSVAANSMRSAHPAGESPFKWFLLNEQGNFTGIFSGYSNDSLNDPRQGFPQVYIPNGYVDVLRASFVRSAGKIHGDNMRGFVTPVCSEVDTQEDFAYLEYELSRTFSPVLEFLKTHYPLEVKYV